ncbi:MAG TPA: hypothetical protein VLC98_14705 [Phnomibacter sp.]|nr:hypothetical protein [Phnomibacter sp.]
MIPLLQYHKLALLDGLLSKGRLVLSSYEEKDLDFASKLKDWLQESDQFFERHNGPVQRSKIKTLHTDFAAVMRGTDPFTFQKFESNKRANAMNIGYRITKDALQVVMDYYTKIDTLLEDARQLIGQIVLAALQGGLITQSEFETATTQPALDLLWKKIATDKQLVVVQKKVLLNVSRIDALLLLEEVRAALKE